MGGEEASTSRDKQKVRAFYKKAKSLSTGFRNGTHALRNCEGNLITDPQGIVDVFKQHSQQLLNGLDQERVIGNQDISTPVDEVVLPPNLEEVGIAIKKLKNNKAAGSGALPSELFKYEGDDLVGSMHQIICRIW